MRSYLLLCLPVCMVFTTGCIRYQYAYYQSPFQTNTSSYKTIPMHTDSTRSATYASAVFTVGTANYRWRDGMGGGIVSIYRSHTSKFVQGYYGFTGMMGNYRVKSYFPNDSLTFLRHNDYLDDSLINSMAGNKTWGGLGLTGGINFSIPFHRHEWRILQLEGSWMQEYGQYLNFRKKLPDTAANLNDPRRNYFTLSIGSDLVFNTRKGQIGFKVATVLSTRKLKEQFSPNNSDFISPGYFSQTFHLTINKVTGFSQWNFGTYAMSWQLGMSYRLGR
jgi:hypothetical protein